MKIPSDELHSLIHSLNRSEKKYFVRFASLVSGKKEKNPLLLFRSMAKQQEYNEKRTKRDLGHIDANHFKKLKHYTTALLLRSQENYHNLTSDEVVVKRLLVQTEVLYDKKLFGAAMKSLDRAQRIAEEKDLLLLIGTCYDWRYRIGVAARRSTITLAETDGHKEQKMMGEAARWMKLRRLNAMFWSIIQDEYEITPATRRKLKDIAAKTLSIFNSSAQGYTISREAGFLLGLCFRFTSEWQKSYQWRKRMVGLLESQPAHLNERCAEYMTSLGNLLNVCREMDKDDEVRSLFEKANAFLSRLPKRYYDQQLDERFCNLQNSYITFLFRKQQYAEVLEQSDALAERLKKHPPVFLNSLISILHRNRMFAAFRLKNMKLCLKHFNAWYRKGLDDEITKKLFGLVIYYESGDLDLLHYKCRSLSYHIRKRKMDKSWQMAVARCLGSDRIDKKKFRELVHSLRAKKKALAATITEGDFDYLSWAQEKAAG